MVTISIDSKEINDEYEYRKIPQIIRLLKLLGDGEWHTSSEIDDAIINLDADAPPPRAYWLKKLKDEYGLSYKKRRPQSNNRIPYEYKLLLDSEDEITLFKSVLEQQIKIAKQSPNQTEATFMEKATSVEQGLLPFPAIEKDSKDEIVTISLPFLSDEDNDWDIPWTDTDSESKRDAEDIPCPVYVTDAQLQILEARGILKDLGMAKLRIWVIFLHHCLPHIMGSESLQVDLSSVQTQYNLSADDLLIWHELYNALLKSNVKKLQRKKENATIPLVQLTLDLDFSNQ
jgi:hypothetical protein